jgi:type VI secretion system protein
MQRPPASRVDGSPRRPYALFANQFMTMRTVWRSAQSAIALLPLAGSLGCSVFRATGVARKDLTLQLTIAPKANDDSVIPVDVVGVANKKLLGTVSDMSAAQWFAKRDDLVRIKGKELAVTSYQFVPGSVLPDQKLTTTAGKAGVVIFANYPTKGDHKAALPDVGTVGLELGPEDFVVHLPKDAAGGKPKAKAPKAPKAPKMPKLPKVPAVPSPPSPPPPPS